MGLPETQAEIAYHLEEIKGLFKPGVKVTLLVRSTAFPDGSRDLLMTDDDLNAAMTALTIRRDAGPDNAEGRTQ